MICCLVLALCTKPATAEQEAISLPKVEVLGSRLLGVEGLVPLPLVKLERLDLERSGFLSLSELLRERPEFGPTGINENVAVSSTRGANALELRGLGTGALLVLVNGRRVTHSANAFGLTTFVDFNRFPLGAIERVEILKGAGAALYGADAVAGVVNIVMRRGAGGHRIAASYGNSLHSDVGEAAFTLTTGAEKGLWSLGVTVDAFRRQAMKAGDRDEFASTNLIPRYQASDPFYASQSAAALAHLDGRSSTGPAARFAVRPGQVNGQAGVWVPDLPAGAAIQRLPGTGTVPANWLAQATPDFTQPFNGLTGGQYSAAAAATFVAPELTPGDPSARNRYDYIEFVWLVPEAERLGLTLTLAHAPGSGPQFFLDAQAQFNRSRAEFAPPPLTLTIPRTHPYNPFGVEVEAYWRLRELGPRRSLVRDDTATVQTGFKGDHPRLSWETALGFSHNDYRDTVSNLLGVEEVRAALARSDAGALNPFGGAEYRHDGALLDSLRRESWRAGTAALFTADAIGRGVLWSPTAGDWQLALLGEFRRETLEYDSDAAARRGEVYGISPGPEPSHWAREARAAAVELNAPLWSAGQAGGAPRLTAHLAARLEEYSVGQGSGLRPTAGLVWQPLPALSLRASYARSFRAPTLPQLFSPRQIDGWDSISDPRRPYALTGDPHDGPTTRPVGTGGNPALLPETATAWQAGVVWMSPSPRGLSLELNGYDYRLNDVVTNLGLDRILGQELGSTAALVTRDPGTETYVNATGAPISILSGPNGERTFIAPGGAVTVPGRLRGLSDYLINLRRKHVAGAELVARYRGRAGPLGRLTGSLTLNRAIRNRTAETANAPLLGNVGSFSSPRWRAHSALDWDREPWSAGVSVSTLGRSGDLGREGYVMPASQVVNLRTGYRVQRGWLAGTAIELAVQNLFDAIPPLVPDPGIGGFSHGYTARPQGRFVRLTVRREL